MTRAFWNANPCDGHPEIEQRMRYRYQKEPWLPPMLETIARCHETLLEVGCGQGTDGIYLCSHKKHGSYTGIDLSDESVKNAREAAQQFADKLGINPLYKTGNAECLEFPDASFDAVYSCGVLHHSPDTRKAIAEVYRVLKKGGTGYIYLYRTASPKVLGAHALRLLFWTLDIVSFQDRLAWKLMRRFGSDHRLGTMLLECCGVPVFKSYTKGQIKKLFLYYSEIEIDLSGIGIPGTDSNQAIDTSCKHALGTMWKITCKK